MLRSMIELVRKPSFSAAFQARVKELEKDIQETSKIKYCGPDDNPITNNFRNEGSGAMQVHTSTGTQKK